MSLALYPYILIQVIGVFQYFIILCKTDVLIGVGALNCVKEVIGEIQDLTEVKEKLNVIGVAL